MGCTIEKEGFDLGVIGSIMSKNIRFNLRPWNNSKSISSKKIEVKKRSFLDIHKDVVKKVDALITENEKELWPEEFESTLTRKMNLDTEKILTDIEKKIWRN